MSNIWNPQEAEDFVNRQYNNNASPTDSPGNRSTRSPHTPKSHSQARFTSLPQPGGYSNGPSLHQSAQPTYQLPNPSFHVSPSSHSSTPTQLRTSNLPVRRDPAHSLHGIGQSQNMSGFSNAPSWSFGRADQHPFASATDSPPQGTSSSPAASVASGTRPPSSSSEVSRRYAQPAPPDALRKRRRDIQADSEAGFRSKRPTPDPGPSAAPSLSRESSNELPDDWKDILGGSDLRAFKLEQRQAEEQVRQEKERRAQQEREDAEMARKLYEEMNGTPLPDPARPTMNRAPSTQSVFGANGKVRKPSPVVPPQAAPVRNSKPSMFHSNGHDIAPKAEPSYRPPARKADPSFMRLDSDDDDLQVLGTRPVSRLHGQNQSSRMLPWSSNTGHTNATSTMADPIDLSNLPNGGVRNLLNDSGPANRAGGTYRPGIGRDSGLPGLSRLPGINSIGGYPGVGGASVYGSSVHRPFGSSREMPGSFNNDVNDLLDNDIASYGSTPAGFSGSSSLLGSNNNLLSDPFRLTGGILPGHFPGSFQTRMPWGSDDSDDSSPALGGFGPNLGLDMDDPLDLSGGYGGYGGGWNDVDNSQALKDLLNNIRPDEEENLGSDDRDGTPEGMADTANLYKYQQKGLAWLSKMEEGSSKGSILADDMGLGKTIQCIALMVSRRSPDASNKTNLIVAPVALIRQWEAEIANKVRPSHKLTTFVYHGTGAEKKKATHQTLRGYDVIITTFGALQTDAKKKMELDKARRLNPDYCPKQNQIPVLIGPDCKWYRCILDEAQNIKNKNAKTSLAAYEVQSTHRLVMTGTPMMNNVIELYSLIHFLRIEPYCKWEKFNVDFARPLKRGNHYGRDRAMQKMQALCKAIMLRRTKKSKMDGKPLVVLPERQLEVAAATFDDDQKAFYTALEGKTQLQFNKYLKAGTVGRNYSNVLTLLLRLRQAACHPHLIKDFAVAIDANPEDLLEAARGLPDQAIQRLIESPIEDCPVCMDTAENYTIFHPCGHSTCPECFCRLADSAQNQAAANDGGPKAPFNCPSCRATIEPSKTTDYHSFKLIHQPELAAQEGIADISPPEDDDDDDDDDSDDETEVESDGDDNGSDLDDFVVDDDDPIEKHESEDDNGDDLDETKPVRPQATIKKSSANGKSKVKAEDDDDDDADFGDKNPDYNKGSNPFEKANGKKLKSKKMSSDVKGKGKRKEKKDQKNNSRKSLAQLKKEGMRNKKARRAYMKRLAKTFIPSAKTTKCMEILQSIEDAGEGEKTIVFSQFTSLLDLIEVPINAKEGWHYTRFDGSMSANERNDAVQLFTKDPRYKIMLVSLKAGNAGLNLTAANQVIILDPFWNPYIEEQAIDRAHRIGQRRTVHIHRVLVEETVEDRIIELQEKKRSLIEGALDEGASKSIGRLGTAELAFLFGVSNTR